VVLAKAKTRRVCLLFSGGFSAIEEIFVVIQEQTFCCSSYQKTSSERSNIIEWNKTKAKYGKTFENPGEEVVRMHIWMENKKPLIDTTSCLLKEKFRTPKQSTSFLP
jgi:hypothetical protein